MTAFLTKLLGRLPIGWLQLSHKKSRLLAAIGGVAFANILIFMQLGFLGALVKSIELPYRQFDADIMISASDANTLADGSPLPRQRMFDALTVDGIASAVPLYYGKTDWKQTDGTIRTLDIFGVDPTKPAFRSPDIAAFRDELLLTDRAIVDAKTRNLPGDFLDQLGSGTPYTFEARGRTLSVVGTFEIGGGFSADGYMIVSDQTFLKLFPQRSSGAPNHILVKLSGDSRKENVIAALKQRLPEYDSQVRTIDGAVRKDQNFQTTQRPVGLIFGFGVFIGGVVGIIIVYQVLSTDVADHMKEYATFKAIGYPQRFFLGIVFEEAFILALLGFVPGLLIPLGLYAILSDVTGLPIAMPVARAVAVLATTLALCALSGALATRRLAYADPADLF